MHRMLAILLLPLALPGDRPPASLPPQSTGWLTGCWQLSRGGTTIEEQWLGPRAGVMLGSSRTVKGDRVLEYEFLVLRAENGGLSYEAHPSGQPTATFRTLGPVTEHEVVFENPEHDFPQRIGYRRAGADSVVAWIEGSRGGQTRRIEFPYARIGCERTGG